MTSTNSKPRADVWAALNRRRPAAAECLPCHANEPMARSAAEAWIAEAGEGDAAFEVRGCARVPGLVHLVTPPDAETEPP